MIKNKRIKICLLLGELYPPDLRLSPHLETISKACHDLTWVMCYRNDNKNFYCHKFNFKHADRELYAYSTPWFIHDSLYTIFLNILAWIKRAKLIIELIKSKNYNIIQVQASAKNVLDGLLALYLKRKYDLHFVFLFQFSPGEFIQEMYKQQLIKHFYLYSFGKVIDKIHLWIMRRADLILPISDCMIEYLTMRGIPKSKMMNFPSVANLNIFKRDEHNNLDIFKDKYNLSKSKIVIYVGTMGRLRQLDMLIRAFARAKKEVDKAKLVMVGRGDSKDDLYHLNELANYLKIQNDVIFTGSVPYSSVPNFIDASDVAVSPVPPLPIFKVASPIKLFEYMAMCKPVVANEEIPEQKEVIQESKGGILVPYNEDGFANAIIELLNNPEKAREMGINGYKWVKRNRTNDQLAHKLKERYFKLLDLNLGHKK